MTVEEFKKIAVYRTSEMCCYSCRYCKIMDGKYCCIFLGSVDIGGCGLDNKSIFETDKDGVCAQWEDKKQEDSNADETSV